MDATVFDKFDYVALGHIHKLSYNEEQNQNIVYPGSVISLGFDETGKHGMIVGNLEKEKINLEFIPLDDKEFKLYDLDVTQINSKEEFKKCVVILLSAMLLTETFICSNNEKR